MRTYQGILRPDYTREQITELKADEIFVFGSVEGMHGGGIAGFRDGEIAPLFSAAAPTENICLPKSFANTSDDYGIT